MEEIKNEKILKAFSNFEQVFSNKKFKFKYLDDWLYTKSVIFKSEVSPNKQTRYKVYPRGTIIYAKFGVNIGSEFSGNHFCVVLNKNDNRNNELVTVVPLTSKDTKFSIKLNESLVLKATEKMEKDNIIIKEDVDKIKQLYQLSLSENKVHIKLNEAINKVENEYKKLFKIIERYLRFSNTFTYAIPSQITTISKNRVTTINKYDPTGHISFSESTLKVIEDYIKINLMK
ncbi:type II toxin-antitoxin system PemK/MazF family toxin [Staphylococcus xylosus]